MIHRSQDAVGAVAHARLGSERSRQDLVAQRFRVGTESLQQQRQRLPRRLALAVARA